jgi:DNA-binding GntR family transcriptional regulator
VGLAAPIDADGREESKVERVYAVLRRRIRELALAPGAPLRKDEIALELGVSRGPVSEAIARLADERLVDVFPQHGSFVAMIRAEDVREGLFIRQGLECEAARRAAVAADPAWRTGLEANLAAQADALAAGDLEGFYDLDEAMHALIFHTAGAPRAQRLLNAARAPLDRARRLVLPEPGRAEATLAEHRHLAAALCSGDAEYAAAAMRAHLSAAARAIERRLAPTEDRS